MFDTIVVGAGIFGSVTAAALRRAGQTVLVIDDGDELAGSRAAGCVLNPAWMTNMTAAEKDAALALLANLYNLQGVVFGGDRQFGAFRVEPGEILGAPGRVGSVTNLTRFEGGVEVMLSRGMNELAHHVVVATGRHAAALCPWAPVVKGLGGWSYRAPPLAQPFVRTWAPYRQVVGINLDDGRAWLGDGCAYTDRSFHHGNAARSMARCIPAAKTLGHTLDITTPGYARRAGIRPYAVAKHALPCLVTTKGRVTCVTGGGKNGTAAAAWAAARVLEIVGAR